MNNKKQITSKITSINDTLTVKDISLLIGKSERTVWQISSKPDFPQHIENLGNPKRWNKQEIYNYFNIQNNSCEFNLEHNHSYECIATLQPSSVFFKPELRYLELFGITQDTKYEKINLKYFKGSELTTMDNSDTFLKEIRNRIEKIEKDVAIMANYSILFFSKGLWNLTFLINDSSEDGFTIRNNELDLSELNLIDNEALCNIFFTKILFNSPLSK